MYIKAELVIQSSWISPTENYKRAVEEAVKDTSTTHDKIQKLREVSEQYGHFYARRLVIGGAIIEDIKHTKYLSESSISKSTGAQFNVGPSLQNNNLHARIGADFAHENENKTNSSNSKIKRNVRVIGGEDIYDAQNGSTTLEPWKKSLKKPNTWKIIGYKEIHPLFELLDQEIQKEVLKALGPRILKSGIETTKFNSDPREFKPHIYSLSSQIDEIKNIDKCQIFASIVSKDDDNVFSLHIDYVDRNPMLPVIVVHHIQWDQSKLKKMIRKKNKNYCESTLCWIIVGLPTSFDFKLLCHPLAFRSGTYPDPSSKSADLRIVKIPNCDLNFSQTCILCICKLEANPIQPTQPATVQPITYDPQNKKIVVGAHFTTCKKSACLFAYNFEKNFVYDETILPKMSLFFCAVDDKNSSQMHNYGQMNIEWKHKSGNISFGKNIENKKALLILTDDLKHPILVNQLFDNCANCQYHGFVNINNSGKVIY
ncbi:15885_t:CDS:2, partial [Cetraspora pellucida]